MQNIRATDTQTEQTTPGGESAPSIVDPSLDRRDQSEGEGGPDEGLASPVSEDVFPRLLESVFERAKALATQRTAKERRFKSGRRGLSPRWTQSSECCGISLANDSAREAHEATIGHVARSNEIPEAWLSDAEKILDRAGLLDDLRRAVTLWTSGRTLDGQTIRSWEQVRVEEGAMKGPDAPIAATLRAAMAPMADKMVAAETKRRHAKVAKAASEAMVLALRQSIFYGSNEELRALVAGGALAIAKGDKNFDDLIHEAARRDSAAKLTVLLDGLEAEAPRRAVHDPDERTPLETAISAGALNSVLVFLERDPLDAALSPARRAKTLQRAVSFAQDRIGGADPQRWAIVDALAQGSNLRDARKALAEAPAGALPLTLARIEAADISKAAVEGKKAGAAEAVAETDAKEPAPAPGAKRRPKRI